MTEAVPGVSPVERTIVSKAEDEVSVAPNWKLVWWRFRKNKLAVISIFVLIVFYLIVLVPAFFATYDPHVTSAKQIYIPPQRIGFFKGGYFISVPAVEGKRNKVTLRMEWTVDPNDRIGLQFLAPGYEYKVLGLKTNIHLLGLADPEEDQQFYLIGTDRLGRDQWSRLMFGTRTSMTVGLIAVFLSVILGVLLGGVSGYFGGIPDLVIQRMIEILQSLPTIPIWLAMTAALPRWWPPERGLLRDHGHPRLHRLDHAGPRGARPLPLAAGGGFRAGRRVVGRQPLPHHHATHGARRFRATSSRPARWRSPS